ncbi:MAG TPA: rod shape-determining protein MreC [Chitinophagaceae bacterium]|jgi:rod shape-determining protein MreC|nr:rod shape-determining protein MreC [Chitinophagaceae bacterium]
MRNIFLFIGRYFTFFAFLGFQVLALSFLFRYNKYHRAVGLGVANEMSGWMNSKYANIDQYFHLKQESDRIHHVNDSLMNLLKTNFLNSDTATQFVQDTIPYDTLGHRRRYLWRDAEVVSNSVNSERNYLQINRGSKQGIRDNMAVLNSDLSLVGIVVNTSDNFSQVMSLLHVKNNVNAVMKRSGNAGTISWDGKSPLYLTMTGIPKSDTIARGDTVLTGTYSLSFPPLRMIGRVASIVKDNSSSFYVLQIKTAANFQNLQHVFVVENLQADEQEKLDKDTRKKIDEVKKTK